MQTPSEFDGLTCHECDYDLRGILSGCCPECGCELDAADLRRRQMGLVRAIHVTRFLYISSAIILLLLAIADVIAFMMPDLEMFKSKLWSEDNSNVYTVLVRMIIVFPPCIVLAAIVSIIGCARDREHRAVRNTKKALLLGIIGCVVAIRVYLAFKL